MNVVIVGVGEIGHQIARLLSPQLVSSVLLIDGDVVASHNPSYRGKRVGEPKVSVALAEMEKMGWRISLVATPAVHPKTGMAFGYADFVSPSWKPLPGWDLVIECTDNSEMLKMPALHVHTGILSGNGAFQIWQGELDVLPLSQEERGEGCTEVLGVAARYAAREVVRQLQSKEGFTEMLVILNGENPITLHESKIAK